MRSKRSRFLSSRVARRIFLLFVLCAFVPLVLFASVSLSNVTAQLERQAEARLHEACKATGMTVVERLRNVQIDIRLALGDRTSGIIQTLRTGNEEVRERLATRLEWIAVTSADSRVLESDREGIVLPALSDKEREHLRDRAALVKTPADGAGNAEVIFVIALPGAEGRFLFTKVVSDYLWGGDELLRPNVDLLALTEDGHLLCATKDHPGVRAAVWAATKRDSSKGRIEANDDGTSYLAGYRTMFTRPSYFRNFVLAYTQSRDVVLAPIETFENLFVLFAVLTLCSVMFASLIQIRRSLVPIDVLSEATRKIQSREFSTRVEIRTRDEFRDLGESFNGMAESLQSHADTMDALHRIGVALTAEKSSEKLIKIVVDGTHHVTTADLVLLHLVDDNGRLRTARLSTRSGDHEGLTLDLDFDLRTGELHPQRRTSDVVLAVTSGRTISIDDIRRSEEFDVTPYEPIEEMLGIRFRSVLCAPLKNHENEIIGVLQLVNASDKATREPCDFSIEDVHVAQSLASQAAVALTKNQLVDDFRDLFESLTELIATAIDEKSQYTGDHCRRVPVLTMMIAQEACRATEGQCADMQLSSDELYELKVAALLHDCGKVTTPVHVVDKATKLEKIIDRIELIDTRFEVVKRDLEIEHLNRCLRRNAAAEQLEVSERVLTEKVAQLEIDRDFLRECNIGGEFMRPERQEAVRRINTTYRWTDPMGITQPFLSDDEIENLCISKGTLTADEREIVNYHVVATIKMLERLPYPKHLRRVPEIAGAHHEKMDGTGYPSGLGRSQISLQGRILGIADVFEALTAKDRPYKPGKTLSETLGILGRMKESGHVDPDLFQLFVESGVYLRYAQEFLDPEQIDAVDLSAIPGFELPARCIASEPVG